MANEYKLSYTASDINEKLGKIAEIDNKLDKSGGTMTGALDMGGYSINSAQEVATETVTWTGRAVDQGVYSQTGTPISDFGNIVAQPIYFYGSNSDEPIQLKNIYSPTESSDATNKQYVDTAVNNVKYTHPSYTARTGVPTANATPAFGGTFSVSQPVSDATGHITAINSRTVTIPSSTATTSEAGLMSASDKTTLSAIADYVTEQRVTVEIGSATSNWGYRKWNSGRAECFLKMPIESVACTTAVGSWYRTATISAPNFPFKFTYYPTVNMYFETISGTGGMVWCTGTSSSTPTTKPINVYIIRMSSAASITGYLNIYAIGRWK